MQAHAIGLADTIPAAFTNSFVDYDADGGFFQFAAASQAALFRGALLIVNNCCYAGNFFQRSHDIRQIVTVAQLGTGGQGDARVFGNIVGENDDLLDALGFEFARQGGNGQCAAGLLSASHCDRTVIENLVRDIYAGCNRGLYGERTGMKVSAIADVLKDMFALDERRHANPRSSLSTHMGQESVSAAGLRLRGRHPVTADASSRYLVIEHQRGAVVRASRAERGRADADFLAVTCCNFSNQLQPRGDGFSRWEIACQCDGDSLGVELAGGGEENFAALIEFAENPRPRRLIVKRD